MIFQNKFFVWINRLFICILVVELTACGSILYPERNGQKAGGPLDVGVVLLDGIGLFFFIIPGVIAYAVDFTNHTIYLPHGRASHKFVQVHVDGKMDQAAIEEVLKDKLGREVNMQKPGLEVVRLSSLKELDRVFAAYGYGEKLALAQ